MLRCHLFSCWSIEIFPIFPTEYRLKLIPLHSSATCASSQHVESNITPKFLGGSSLGEIDWSPTLIDISDILLSSSRVVMIRSSVLLSFNFKKLSFIHISMSATQASIRHIASHLDVMSNGLNAIYSLLSSVYRRYVNPCLYTAAQKFPFRQPMKICRR